MLDRLDDWLFDARCGFENISHRFERLTGKTCFWIAKQLALLGTGLFGFNMMVGVVHNGITTNTAVVFFASLLIVLPSVGIRIKVYDIMEKSFLLKEGGTMNKRRVLDKKFRKIIPFFLPLILLSSLPHTVALVGKGGLEAYGELAITAAIILFPLEFYFIACTPHPLGRSKVREWQEKIQAWFIVRPATAPSS
ncbi:MAG: hypothetical protein AAB858_00085 [Patescibacteria group bacterium]